MLPGVGAYTLLPIYSVYSTAQLFVVHVVSYCRSRSSEREQSKANIVRTICARSLAGHVAHTLSLQNITMQNGMHEAMGEGVSSGQLTPNLKLAICPHRKRSNKHHFNSSHFIYGVHSNVKVSPKRNSYVKKSSRALNNQKAELSQRRPRDAPNIWVPGKISRVLTAPTATFPEICIGLLFRSILRMCVQNLKFVALPVPEIKAVDLYSASS